MIIVYGAIVGAALVGFGYAIGWNRRVANTAEGWADAWRRTAQTALAQAEGGEVEPSPCEGCGKPGRFRPDADVDLCDGCHDALLAAGGR
jgi:hypothetical protein